MPDAAKVVDAKGQSCPMPVLMTAKGIKEIESGEILLLEATDNGASVRYRVAGKGHRLHELSRFVREEGRWYYVDGELDPPSPG